jgi:hypothetical protein
VNHKDWLDNEYKLWVGALKESTVGNFGSHPMVRRMLGEVDPFVYRDSWTIELQVEHIVSLEYITELGCKDPRQFQGIVNRMIYYAEKVLKANPAHIAEIGGGVGQFYAVLRALGYKGKYYIFDLAEVIEFQRKYLDRVTELTGLDTSLESGKYDYCVSFYAWGEFHDELKKWYLYNVIKQCPHGLIVFNPHSGASAEIGFECDITEEEPLTSSGNKLLVW